LEERREPSLGLEQLDDHEALLKVFPEFKLGGGHMVTKILEGLDSSRRSEGEAALKLRDATVGITLRHLYTLSSQLRSSKANTYFAGYRILRASGTILTTPGSRIS
jgi:hypothetical protein